MGRLLIDLPDAQIEALAVLVRLEHRSRAYIIRDAIDGYIALHQRSLGADVFGMWGRKNTDGLEYQNESRAEW